MTNEEQKMAVEENVPRENIKKRVIRLEKSNYALKPEGAKDREMVDRIKKIIEQEVGK